MKSLDKILTKRNLLIANFLLWMSLLGLSILETYAWTYTGEEEINWTRRLTYISAIYFSFWILSHLVFFAYQRLGRLPLARAITFHFIAALLFAVMHTLVEMALLVGSRKLLGEYPDRSGWEVYTDMLKYAPPTIIGGFIIYWLVVIILLGWDFYRRYKNQYLQNARLESELAQAHLQTLKMQLQPHFLFNSLNTISMMVRRKKEEEAVDMITGLSDLLRESLSRENEQFVKLSEEIDLVKKYLDIEQIRFKEKITIDYDIPKDCLRVPVPNMILQPIIENAIKHGISESLKHNRIEIKAKKIDHNLLLTVFNSGSLLGEQSPSASSNGIGLINTRSRLQQLYADQHGFDIINKQDQGVEVTIRIPLMKGHARNKDNHRR